MARNAPQYSIWLDFIRGCAALAVFIGHARVLFLESIVKNIGLVAQSTSPQNIVSSAAIVLPAQSTNFSHQAVIVFFVLSGYLVGGSVVRSYRSGSWSIQNYTIQRLSRLWTVLIPALLLTAALDAVGISIFGREGIYGAPQGQEIVFGDLEARSSTTTFMLNLFFFQGLVTGSSFGTNSPLWTLAYEFWFYAAFPLLISLLWPKTSTTKRILSFMSLVGICYFFGTQFVFYFALWLAGCSLELVRLTLPEKWIKPLSSILGILFITTCILLVKLKPSIFISDIVVTAMCWLLIYCLLHQRSPSPNNLFTRTSSKLSDLSYTLYLCHAPLLVFVCAMLMNPWTPWALSLENLLKFSLVLATVFFCAFVMYMMFERNTQKVRRAITNRLKIPG